MAHPLPLRLYNSLTRRLEAVVPQRAGEVRMYCCGPTTYDVSHVGHGRSAVLPDLLVRHLRAHGLNVVYARNITDVDDKIVHRARERSEEPLALSARFALAYQHDVARLGCVPPTHEPRVSECLPEIISMIERLITNGAAYAVPAGAGHDVWYAVRQFAGYGKLSGRNLDDLQAGEGLEERGKVVHHDKRDPFDFALWKSAPDGEWAFDSPWGRGRPGWHIECSAMTEKFLGFGFDLHFGGMDLLFPHHENEIAQSEACHPGEGDFCRHWVHGGFITVDREKMAKSLGNFFTLADCFARNDPEALRYFYLSAHYRGPIEFDVQRVDAQGHVIPLDAPRQDGERTIFPGLDEAEERVDYLYSALERLDGLAAQAPDGAEGGIKELAKLAQTVRSARARVTSALDEDLNTSAAIAVVGELAKAGNDLVDLAVKRRKDARFFGGAALLAREAADALRSSTDVLGLLQVTPVAYQTRCQDRRLRLRGLEREAIDSRIAARVEARTARDFARSDSLRQELTALGVEVFDSPTGSTWRIGQRTS
ncbi:MAG: cysteine--tRNA ligase [Myxococcales bacterium]|nr:MAG: cysteine--tRNA ligase [Myxococcales bacterium]